MPAEIEVPTKSKYSQDQSHRRMGKELSCPVCTKLFYVKRLQLGERNTCSRACMAEDYKRRFSGDANHNFRYYINANCLICKRDFKNYNKRSYCSITCLRVGQMIDGRMQHAMGWAKRVDHNQEEIIGGLRDLGASVMILSHLGNGCPDICVGIGQTNVLMEIKNPKTSYGRRGLNKMQRAFADWWPGPFVVAYTLQDAIASLRALGWKPATETRET